jgi:lipopolysaccharide export system protein LptA
MIVYATSSEKTAEKSKNGEPSADASMMKQIDHIEVVGDVKITQRDKIAVADKSVYYHKEQKVVLMGNPSVTQGQDRVEGRLITLYLASGKSVVEGGEATPVQAVLHPKKD